MIRTIPLCLLLTACAAAPDVIRPEIEHMSHATQHPPFVAVNENYGANLAGITAEWKLRDIHIELNESVNISHGWSGNGIRGYGEIEGPRESFSARVGYDIHVKD